MELMAHRDLKVQKVHRDLKEIQEHQELTA